MRTKFLKISTFITVLLLTSFAFLPVNALTAQTFEANSQNIGWYCNFYESGTVYTFKGKFINDSTSSSSGLRILYNNTEYTVVFSNTWTEGNWETSECVFSIFAKEQITFGINGRIKINKILNKIILKSI